MDYEGATEQHPVCKEILNKVGSGIEGRELRKFFAGSPYGWPQDAVDGGIIALHAGQHLLARYNGQALAVGQLYQNKVSKTEFRTESIIQFKRFYIPYRGNLQTTSAPSHLPDAGPAAIVQTPSAQLSQGVALAKEADLNNLAVSFTLSWSHYAFLVQIADERERRFYEIEAGRENWSLAEFNWWNDCHYTTTCKRAARERKAKK